MSCRTREDVGLVELLHFCKGVHRFFGLYIRKINQFCLGHSLQNVTNFRTPRLTFVLYFSPPLMSDFSFYDGKDDTDKNTGSATDPELEDEDEGVGRSDDLSPDSAPERLEKRDLHV